MHHLSYTPIQSMMVCVKTDVRLCMFRRLRVLSVAAALRCTAGAQHAQEDTLLELCGAYIVQRCFEPCQVGASYNETCR